MFKVKFQCNTPNEINESTIGIGPGGNQSGATTRRSETNQRVRSNLVPTRWVRRGLTGP